MMPLNEWTQRANSAYDTAMSLFTEAGWQLPTISLIEFKRNGPAWISDGKGTGRIEFDPTVHDPEAIAHEIAHGVHEILRNDPKFLNRIVESEGEAFCEMVRCEVERRRGNERWYSNYAPAFIKRFNRNWIAFVEWVNGG